MAFTWKQFHRKYLRYLSLKWVWNLLIWDCSQFPQGAVSWLARSMKHTIKICHTYLIFAMICDAFYHSVLLMFQNHRPEPEGEPRNRGAIQGQGQTHSRIRLRVSHQNMKALLTSCRNMMNSFLGNMKMYLCFVSFLSTQRVQIIDVFPHGRKRVVYSA